MPLSNVHFWRDTSGREIDFVIPFGRDRVDAIECKWSANAATTRNFRAFRNRYPEGDNWVVARDVDRPYRRGEANMTLTHISLDEMRERLRADHL